MIPLILIGGGGHCRSCIDVIEQTEAYQIQGILDVAEKVGQSIFGIPIVGTDSDILKWIANAQFLITVGQIHSSDVRSKIAEQLRLEGAELATVISPLGYVSRHAVIQRGAIVMHGALVNAGAVVGQHCILNTGSVIEHDAQIGNETHVATGAYVNGDARIGNRCFIGSHATINQGISIADGCLIGSGAVVTESLQVPGTYVGIPARKRP